jgi:PPOX class probable F420-dependent enzyme
LLLIWVPQEHSHLPARTHVPFLPPWNGTARLSCHRYSSVVDSRNRLVVSTRETAIKTLNVRRDPRAWLCVLNDRFIGEWAQLSGDVEVVGLPQAMEPLVEYYRSISGEHPDWDDYRAAMIKQGRCLIRITPTKAGPTVFG